MVAVVHCDFPACIEQAARPDVNTMPDGWTSAVHTHGCPYHGAAIAAHAADVECTTRRSKDWWSLRCACGWRPTPAAVNYSARELEKQHLLHVADVLRVESNPAPADPNDRQCFCPECIRCGCGIWERHHASLAEVMSAEDRRAAATSQASVEPANPTPETRN
jgi:hypothetical protein